MLQVNPWLKRLRRWDPTKTAYAQRTIVISDDVSVLRGEVFISEDPALMERLFNIGWISHARFGDGFKPPPEPAVTVPPKAAGKSRK